MENLFDINIVFEAIPQLLEYLPVTLELTLFSMIIGIILGVLIAIIRLEKTPVLNILSRIYVSFVRGTPVIVQLYISYFGLPLLFRYLNARFGWGINVNGIPGYVFSILALGINQSAYLSETFRAAFNSVDRGQIEAAESLGMKRGQTFRRILLPSAMTVAVPGIGNSLISLVKGTSLAFTTSVIEMTAQGRIIGGRTFRYFEVYIALAIIYWAVTIVLEVAFYFIEKRMQIPDQAPNQAKEPVNDLN